MPEGPTSKLILASASPRRLALLRQIDVLPDQIEAAEIDETAGVQELPPKLAGRLANEKSHIIANKFPGAYVLGADTVVACGRRVLPKPLDVAVARAHLQLLSGRRHRVYTGVCMIGPDGHKKSQRLVSTVVKLKRLTDGEIKAYLE